MWGTDSTYRSAAPHYLLPIFGKLAVVVIGAACSWFVLATGAGAAEGPAVTGRLLDDGRPVVGVDIEIQLDGDVVGTGASDATGAFHIAVPGAGTYAVVLDVDTLPDGVALADPDRATLPRVTVQATGDKTVVFAFAPSDPPDRTSRPERFGALVWSGVRFGLIIAVAGVGLTLVYATSGVTNLAHGELVTFGALVAWYLNANGVPLPVAGVLAAGAGALLGVALDTALWRPLRRRRTEPTTVMVITIGLSLFLRNVYLLVFEGGQRPFADFAVQHPWSVGIDVLPKDVALVVLALVVLGATSRFLERTRTGTAMRAVGDVADLAEASGIDGERALRHAWALAAGLAAVGGVMVGVTDAVQWDLGLRLVLLMFAAVVLGGLGNVRGAVVGGLAIGLLSEVSTYWIATDFKTLVALVLLVGCLLVRPQGLLGHDRTVE
jgi:branched-chain amino acid transport system permease protein